MKDVDQRFALVDNTSGEKLFPYKSRQEKTGRFGFALSEPGKQNRKGEGIYTEDIHEVIDSVVNKGWKVRVKTIDGKRHGSMTINRNSKLSYWIASEFWDLVKNSPTGPMTLLPSNNSTANATRQFTDAEIRDLK